MSLQHIVMEDFPRRFWMLDGLSPHADYSGYEQSVTHGTSLTNMVWNPRGGDTTNYVVNTGISTLTSEVTRLKLVFNGTAGMAQLYPDHTPIPVVNGDKAWVSFRYQGPGLNNTAIVHHRNSSNAIVRQTVVTLPVATSGEVEVTFPVNVVDASVTNLYLAQLIYGQTAHTAGETHYFSRVLFTKSNAATAPPYFDGSTPGGKWNGTASASTSTAPTHVISYPVNLFTNPSAETNLTGFGTNRVTIARTSEWAADGNWAVRATRTSDPSTDAFIELGGLLRSGWGTLKLNTQYTIIGTVNLNKLYPGKAEGVTLGAQEISLFWHLNGGQSGGSVTAINKIGPQTIKATFTTPTTSLTGYNTLRAYVGQNPGDYLDWDNFMLIEGAYTNPAFNGDSQGAAWSGTAHNSESYSYSGDYGPALVKGAAYSLLVNNNNKLSVTAPAFIKGKEYLPFSVEAFVRPVTTSTTGPIQIFGNDGYEDGLVIEGNKVSFVTKYATTGEARASFDVMDPQSLGIVGVHSQNKNQLFINGELVSEVDITAAQQADTYSAPGNNLAIGSSTSSNSLLMNAVSVYDTALADDDIIRHYANAQDTLSAEDVSISYRGALLEFGLDGAISPFYQIEYSSDEEWGLGVNNNVSLHDGTLYPVSVNNVSQSGYWETVVPMGYLPSTIHSGNLLWEGTGATVSTSRDGSTWTTASKGMALSTIPRGTNGEGQFLFIRVTFPGGVVDDPSYFDNMVFSLYSFGTAPSFNGREVVMTGVSMEDDTDVIDYHENWGAELRDGTLTIKAGTSTATIVPKTIEVWAKAAGSGAAFTDNLSSATDKYSNGSVYKAYRPDEWQLRHYVFPNGFTGDITFSGTGQIGHVILYPEVKSGETIKAIYKSYTGKPRISLNVSEVFDIHEFAGAVDIYEYDWAIESSG